MKKRSKSISRVLIWQIASQVMLTGIATLTTPLFTRLLSKSEYGTFTNFNSWVAIVGVVLSLQTAGSIINAKTKYNDKEYVEYSSSILVLSVVGFFVAIVVSLLFKSVFARGFTLDEEIVPLVFIVSLFSYVVTFYSQKLTVELKVEKNMVLAVINSVITLLLSLWLVTNMQTNKHLGRIYGMLVPLVVISLYEIADVLIHGKCIYKREYWNYCLTLTFPLIFHALAGMVLSLSDKVMLTKMNGEETTAVYGVAYSMGSIINTIWVAFNSTWTPFYYQYKKENNNTEINRKLKNYAVIFTIISVGFLLCTPEVYKIFAPSTYWSGLIIIPPIVMGYYFNFMYSIFGNFEFYHEKTRMISVGTILCAIINLILNLILIPMLNEFGAAIATVASYALLYVFHWTISKKFLKEECELKNKYLLVGMGVVCAFSMGYYLTMELYVIRWILAAILGIYTLRTIIIRRSIL